MGRFYCCLCRQSGKAGKLITCDIQVSDHGGCHFWATKTGNVLQLRRECDAFRSRCAHNWSLDWSQWSEHDSLGKVVWHFNGSPSRFRAGSILQVHQVATRIDLYKTICGQSRYPWDCEGRKRQCESLRIQRFRQIAPIPRVSLEPE